MKQKEGTTKKPKCDGKTRKKSIHHKEVETETFEIKTVVNENDYNKIRRRFIPGGDTNIYGSIPIQRESLNVKL